MTSVQSQYPPSNGFVLPDTAAAQNAVALFIFAIPMGTLSQDLFVNPIYRSVRNTIAKRCNCELAVFDGNTMLQRSHSGPRSTKGRVRNGHVDNETGQTSTGLLINITNTHEQVLFARGNWLIQVNYLTEPSEHHLFLKLVDDFATRLNSSGGYKRGAGSSIISQGFKFTTLVVLTHDKLRHAYDCSNLTTTGQTKQKDSSSRENSKSRPIDLLLSDQKLPREWGEFPSTQSLDNINEDDVYFSTNKIFEEYGRSRSLGPPQEKKMRTRLYQSGDLISEEFQKSDRFDEKASQERRLRFEEIESFLRQTERNYNHQLSEEFASTLHACSKEVEVLGMEENTGANGEEADVLFSGRLGGDSLQILEREIAELENMVNS